jgi:anti-sigma factor RsiW
MNCVCVERCLDAFVDHEFDGLALEEIERHLESCSECGERVKVARWLKASLKSEAQVNAPPELRMRVQAALAEESASSFRQLDTSWRTTAAAAAMALFVFGVGGALEIKGRTAQAGMISSLFEDVVRAHSRTYPAEVAQGDQVPAYFQERVGFPVRPVKFADPALHFVGARHAEVGGRKAVTLRYETTSGRHVTVVAFRLPPQAEPVGEQAQAAGRTLRYVRVAGHLVPLVEHDGVVYAVVGDLNSEEPLRMAARASLR